MALPLGGSSCTVFVGFVVVVVVGVVVWPQGRQQLLEELVGSVLKPVGASGWVRGVLGVVPV